MGVLGGRISVCHSLLSGARTNRGFIGASNRTPGVQSGNLIVLEESQITLDRRDIVRRSKGPLHTDICVQVGRSGPIRREDTILKYGVGETRTTPMTPWTVGPPGDLQCSQEGRGYPHVQVQVS